MNRKRVFPLLNITIIMEEYYILLLLLSLSKYHIKKQRLLNRFYVCIPKHD